MNHNKPGNQWAFVPDFMKGGEAGDSEGKPIAQLVAFILTSQHETLPFSPPLCMQLMKSVAFTGDKKVTTAATNGKVTHFLYNQQTKP